MAQHGICTFIHTRTYAASVFDRASITQLFGSERVGARDGRQRNVAGVRYRCGMDSETTQHHAIRLTLQIARARAWCAWRERRPGIVIRAI